MYIGNSSRGQVRKEAIACGASSSVSEAPVKETCEEGYATLLDLVTSEDIYLVNFYGRVYKLDERPPCELLRHCLMGSERTSSASCLEVVWCYYLQTWL